MNTFFVGFARIASVVFMVATVILCGRAPMDFHLPFLFATGVFASTALWLLRDVPVRLPAPVPVRLRARR